MTRPLALRMIRETIYFYQSQILRLESLSLRTGMNKSELLRVGLEAFLRFHGLKDQEFRVLPNEMEETVPEYKEKFMEPFVEILQEGMEEEGTGLKMRRLQFHHREIMRRLLKGERQCVVAREMGMSEVSVSRIVNDPVFLRVSLNVQQADGTGADRLPQ